MAKILKRIKSIRRLQYVDAGECASWLAAPGTGVAIPDDAMLSGINIEPFASMTEKTAPDNGTDVCETVIKARTYDTLPADLSRKVWVATAINGTRWVVGKTEQPYATASVEDSYPDDPAGDHATVLTVTLRATHGAMRAF